jgi:hypothetical protein
VGFDPHEPEQRSQLKDALSAADITVGELWLRYFSMSGSAGEYEVHAYLQGLISLPVTQRDLLALACNEIIGETPPRYAPYADQMHGVEPDDVPSGEVPSGEVRRREAPPS